ncbi:MAG: Rpn family recombination-promoting nuclease/putative transposase [Treponema sp.]|nr:Rpn family recombination-promoting nuclease/putative transposase [Treponema sp.]
MAENINKQIKSSLFIDYFGKDEIVGKRNFLELYNALHDTNYTLENTELKIREIDDTMYKTFRNDIGMELNGHLVVLIEHQSTVNNNMPLRFLEYVSRIYTSMVPGKVRYREKLFKIPTPEFLVFYNGKKELPKYSELKLSDAYYEQMEDPNLELKVKVYNINNSDLPVVRKCDKIRQYCEFINYIYTNANIRDEESCRKVIKAAQEKGLLSDYLGRKITEVVNMLTAEYDYDLDIAVKKEEAYEDGFNDGFHDGFEDGFNDGFNDGGKAKSLEDALVMINDFNLPIDLVCAKLNIEKEVVLEAMEKKTGE